ncbi:hypothetical protein SARC_15171, partial [Sphaeroforma arctica JP610]
VASIVALVVLVTVITAVHIHKRRRQRGRRITLVDDSKLQLALRKEGLNELEAFTYRKPTEKDDLEGTRLTLLPFSF